MLTSRRRRGGSRSGRSRALSAPLALASAAVLTLAAAPVAAAQSGSQSTAAEDGALAVSSLGSTNEIPGSVAGSAIGSLGSLGSLDPADPAPRYSNYVALGDSYAAFGDQSELAADEGDPAEDCYQSTTNYPSLLSDDPRISEVTDVTCGGAVIEDILTDEQHPGLPPQIEALEADTDLVTLSIGGNDVGFGSIVQCLVTPIFAGNPPNDCRAQWNDTVVTNIDDVFGEGGTIDDVYDAIAESAPDATVFATQYLPLVPTDGADGCDFTDAIGPENLEWAIEITDAINVAVEDAAQRNGHVSVLPVDEDGLDRSGCAPADQRWTHFYGDDVPAAEFHPTALGQEAMANAIAAQFVGVLI